MGDGGKALLDADECRKRKPDWPKACFRQGAALMLLKVTLKMLFAEFLLSLQIVFDHSLGLASLGLPEGL
jgi:hypothetical protein